MNKQELNHNIRNPLAIIYAQLAVTRGSISKEAKQRIIGACERVIKTLELHTNEPLKIPMGLTAPYDEFDFDFYYESEIEGASDFEVECKCTADKDGRIELVRVFQNINDINSEITIYIQHSDAWDQILEKAEEIARKRIDSAA